MIGGFRKRVDSMWIYLCGWMRVFKVKSSRLMVADWNLLWMNCSKLIMLLLRWVAILIGVDHAVITE